MNADALETLAPIVASVAHGCANRAKRWGEPAEDDFRQEFWEWILSHQKQVLDKHEELGDTRLFEKWVARSLWNEGHDYALDIRAQAGGQDRASAYWYTEAEVEALLDIVFDREQWLHPPQHDGEGSRSSRAPEHGNNWAATLADISRAYDALGKDDRTLLYEFHALGMRNRDLSRLYEVSDAAMSARHGRAVRRLLVKLGGTRPQPMRPSQRYDPWRGRHAVSNAHARAITAGQWEE